MKYTLLFILLLGSLILTAQPHSREWATYVGDNGLELEQVATDVDGYLYLVGSVNYSSSTAAYINAQSYQSDYGGGVSDGFILKMSPQGQLLWFTYYGGTAMDKITGIAIADNVIYVTGTTESGGMATPGVHQTALQGIQDGFIAAFTNSGSRVWHTYFGGEGKEETQSLTVYDNHLYFFGKTTSRTQIATMGSFQEEIHPRADGFYVNNYIAKCSTQGILEWASYYGPANESISAGGAGESYPNYITGITANSTGVYLSGFIFMLHDISYFGTPGAYLETANVLAATLAGLNLYLSKFSFEGERLWSTYFYANNSQTIQPSYGGKFLYRNITATEQGVYISGRTGSNNIGTSGSFQPTRSGIAPFVVNFTNTGALVWGSYLGNETSNNNNNDSNIYLGGLPINLTSDSEGSIYMSGAMYNIGDVATPDGYQTALNNNSTDCYMAKISADGTTKLYGTYYGGSNGEGGGLVAPISEGRFYLIGTTRSETGMTTQGAFQENFITNGEPIRNIFVVLFKAESMNTQSFNNVAFHLYPNPAHTSFTIQRNEITDAVVTVYDMLGKKVLQQPLLSESATIDCGALAKGVYMVKVTNQNKQQQAIQKVIIH
jgi:hypothetical protein